MRSVRPAEPGDDAALCRLVAEMHAEGIYRDVPFDASRVARFVAAMRDAPDCCSLVHIDSTGAPSGMLIGCLQGYFFSEERAANDLVFYVAPHRRGSAAAVRLFQAFSTWARSKGAARLWLGVSTGIAAERTGRLYQRLGLRHVGGAYVMPLPG